MNISKILPLTVMAIAAMIMTSCNNKKFHIVGTISQAKDSMLYLDYNGLDGYKTIDSVKLDEDGKFSFDEQAGDTISPEFYRLRIAKQFINLSIDSTETVNIKAAYSTMGYSYDVSGSENCSKIKELAIMQMQLQESINALSKSSQYSMDSIQVAINAAIEEYKNNVKINYIFKAPMKAYSYYALFQTVNIGNQNTLIFNPRNNKKDVQVFAAVATSWDSFYPGSERGKNLHEIAIQGMKDVRIIAAEQSETIDANKVHVSSLIDIALQDNKGMTRKLTDLKGKVVLLDFHLFASDNSTKRIMMLRELYNKYHTAGLEIYQVSIDPDEHFWKTQVSALPWISVRDPDGAQSENLIRYNIQNIPTFFLIDRNNVLQKRDTQIKDINAEIKSML
nr:redoxin domain-containing protein [Prevotella sp.]